MKLYGNPLPSSDVSQTVEDRRDSDTDKRQEPDDGDNQLYAIAIMLMPVDMILIIYRVWNAGHAALRRFLDLSSNSGPRFSRNSRTLASVSGHMRRPSRSRSTSRPFLAARMPKRCSPIPAALKKRSISDRSSLLMPAILHAIACMSIHAITFGR